MPTPNPRGDYAFLPGGEPYSSGVAADAGVEIAPARGAVRDRAAVAAAVHARRVSGVQPQLPRPARKLGPARGRTEPGGADERRAGAGGAVRAGPLRLLLHRSGRSGRAADVRDR